MIGNVVFVLRDCPHNVRRGQHEHYIDYDVFEQNSMKAKVRVLIETMQLGAYAHGACSLRQKSLLVHKF